MSLNQSFISDFSEYYRWCTDALHDKHNLPVLQSQSLHQSVRPPSDSILLLLLHFIRHFIKQCAELKNVGDISFSATKSMYNDWLTI